MEVVDDELVLGRELAGRWDLYGKGLHLLRLELGDPGVQNAARFPGMAILRCLCRCLAGATAQFAL